MDAPFALPPLSLAMAGLTPPTEFRAALDAAARLGLRAITLDGAAPGLRARELDRPARRDVAALLRRAGLTFGGIDLWIPPEHFTGPATADRALAAVQAACGLAVDLARLADGHPVVSLTLPEGAADAVRAVDDAAQRAGAEVADHAWPPAEGDRASIGVGLDPAAILLRGADPAQEASRALAARRVLAARLADVSAGGARAAPGRGRLDPLAFGVALATGGFERTVTLDLRGVDGWELAAANALDAWGVPGARAPHA